MQYKHFLKNIFFIKTRTHVNLRNNIFDKNFKNSYRSWIFKWNRFHSGNIKLPCKDFSKNIFLQKIAPMLTCATFWTKFLTIWVSNYFQKWNFSSACILGILKCNIKIFWKIYCLRKRARMSTCATLIDHKNVDNFDRFNIFFNEILVYLSTCICNMAYCANSQCDDQKQSCSSHFRGVFEYSLQLNSKVVNFLCAGSRKMSLLFISQPVN